MVHSAFPTWVCLELMNSQPSLTHHRQPFLAVGGGTRRIVPTPYIDGAEEQPKPSIKTIMTARLSADRRVVDEATASLFMSAFKHYINKPELLLL